MSRPLRIEYPGALYHVTSRGDRRENIVENDRDRELFFEVLALVVGRYNWLCHSYCLMDNHYHLIIETPQANLSKGMRQLNGLYTQRYNRMHKRVGHVFQGRYKAILVDKDSHLLELCRYVVLNPVRAKMVRRASDWRWSSYRATVGFVAAPEFLTVDWILSQFGKQKRRAQQHYMRFVQQGRQAPSVWQGLQQQIFLGDERFIKKLLRQAAVSESSDDLKEIPRQHRKLKARPLRYYAKRYRDQKCAMYEAYSTGWYSQREIAEHFGVHYSTVSRIVKNKEMRQCKTRMCEWLVPTAYSD